MKWPVVEIGSITIVVGGSTPRRENPVFWNGDIPWVTPTDLPKIGEGIGDVTATNDHITEQGLDSCSAQIVPVGSVLFSSRATIGKLGLAGVPLTTNQGFINLIPGPLILSKFLAYTLWYHTPQIATLSGQTTFTEVTKGAFRKFRIPLPPLSEQRRIVEILDQADALRRKRAEADARAARILPALFYKMFGDPATNPMGWPTKSLGEVVIINPKAKMDEHSRLLDITFVPMTAIDEKRGVIANPESRRCDEVATKGYTPFQDNDVLFAKITPCMENGKAAIATNLLNGLGFGSTEFHVLRPKLEVMSAYVFALVRQESLRQHAKQMFTGTAGQQRVPPGFLHNYICPIPPIELQSSFTKYLGAIRIMETSHTLSTEILDGLFSTLLHRAFSGDLTARWREAHMAELLAEMEDQARALEAGTSGREQLPFRSG
jgi:type I restriction enzyme S subunit